MERYQVRTVKALLEDPETFSISTLALSTANRVTRTDCRQGDNVGASPTLACVSNEQVERTDRADTQIGSSERCGVHVLHDAGTLKMLRKAFCSAGAWTFGGSEST
jgi:hypothetical protein